MGKITLGQAAEWCGGFVEEKYADVEFFGANNDSRKLEKGQLFVALQGERDGHDFIPKALSAGAAAVLCSRCTGDFPAIVVEDTRIALGKIAAGERNRLGLQVVGVTGSVGKSTTKEMIACVLESKYKVAKTPANHNNDIGLPMAILSIEDGTEIAVLEMGMNHFREIAYLTGIAKPDIAVIINIGTMHIEHLGSQEGILKAKLEILEGMADTAPLLYNGDDALLQKAGASLPRPTLAFGQSSGCKVQALDVRQEESGISFVAVSGDVSINICLPLEGSHYVSDALAAISVGISVGVSPREISSALENFRNLSGRQEILQIQGYTVIKDCYNAGPESMAAALAVLGKKDTRRIAVLGDMLELGVCTQAEHFRVGRLAAQSADLVLAYGPNSHRLVSGCYTGGMSQSKAMAFSDRSELVDRLKHLAKPGDTLLFKGSHGMHMELALEQFLKEDT